MDYFSTTRTAVNRTRWKGVVAKASGVPSDLARLRER